MLEAKNLVKIYKPKKGVPVTALDDVSLQLPEKGMVFILGKSGSGKSTLLNVLGGLDGFNSGEIIIKGSSAKGFKQRDYDSYRNTYIGFIFQEYNILEEFSVGANIALAIELQGRKPTEYEIDNILKEVDLTGYANRKPNELSGGQKQRVAIARALVKKPEIIMADEPTGALDSETGKQVFETLKKLSSDKLVLIVSHDRDFAEGYADRIIELADGKIISDQSLYKGEENEVVEQVEYNDDEILVKEGYKLTKEDLDKINNYLETMSKDVSIRNKKSNLKGNYKFIDTDVSDIEMSKDGYKLIKSKLNLKNAFKIGASGLKHKKFRLGVTIFLSFVAFTLFGLADTIASYDKKSTAVKSIMDQDVEYASYSKSVKKIQYGEEWWVSYGNYLTETDINRIKSESKIQVKGLFQADSSYSISNNYGESLGYTSLFPTALSGFVEFNSSELAEYGYQLVAGRIPDGTKNEIAISKYVYQGFVEHDFRQSLTTPDENGNYEKICKIRSYNDLIGKTMYVGGSSYEVVGIIDTKFDYEAYRGIEDLMLDGDLFDYFKTEELDSIQKYSLNCAIFVGEGFVSDLAAKSLSAYHQSSEYGTFSYKGVDYDGITPVDKPLDNFTTIDIFKMPIYDLSGNLTTYVLAKNEIYLSDYCIVENISNITSRDFSGKVFTEILDSANPDDQRLSQIYSWYILPNMYYDDVRSFFTDTNLNEGAVLLTYLMTNEEYLKTAVTNVKNYGVLYTEEDYNAMEQVERYETALQLLGQDDVNIDTLFPEYKTYYLNFMKSFISRHNLGKFVISNEDATKVIYNLDKAKDLNEIYGYSLSIGRYNSYVVISDIYNYTLENFGICNYVIKYVTDNFDSICDIVDSGSSAKYGSTKEFNSICVKYYSYLTKYDTQKMVEETNGINEAKTKILSYYANKFEMNSFQMKNSNGATYDLVVKGVYFNDADHSYSPSILLGNDLAAEIMGDPEPGIYSFAIGSMPKSKAGVKNVVKLDDKEFGNIRYCLNNTVTYQLDLVEEILDVLGSVFLWVSIFFAVFASIMLSNFIATSVAYKKQDIGILRAIGSRSNDVFRIFFAEAFIIAMVNFVLASIGTIAISLSINSSLSDSYGIKVSILNFSVRQIGLLLAVTIAVAWLSTLLPVKKIASKKPIDAIRNR